MKDAYLPEQYDSHAATLAFADLCPKIDEEGFDILPLDVRTRRVSEDKVQRALMFSLHAANGTAKRYCIRGCNLSDG